MYLDLKEQGLMSYNLFMNVHRTLTAEAVLQLSLRKIKESVMLIHI